jgi:hypothetical protein
MVEVTASEVRIARSHGDHGERDAALTGLLGMSASGTNDAGGYGNSISYTVFNVGGRILLIF